MSKQPVWISKKALLLLHELSLSQFGGAPGLRDDGLLDSALARAQNLHLYNAKATVAESAASYGFGLARNHAFVDGNKRAAFLAIGMFLAINGRRLNVSQIDAFQAMLALARGELDESALARWIALHCERSSK